MRLLLVIVISAALIYAYFQTADPGGLDDGKLHLAGATALLQDGSYPILQRPPVYSLVLAGIGKFSGVDLTPADVAQELGSLDTLPIAAGLVTPEFLRTALIVNVILWGLAVVLAIATLQSLKIPQPWIWGVLILSLMPVSWRMVGTISETALCQFWLLLGLYSVVQVVVSQRWYFALIAGIALALAGITRATFQLLPLVIVFACLLIAIRPIWRGLAIRLIAGMLIPYVVLVGGWSWHNLTTHGVWGVSGVSGVALSTRTALYLEQGQPDYPDEVAAFRNIRDQLFIDSINKEDVAYWGARAANWLMKNRDLSYIEANQFLLKFNLNVITAAPLNYLATVSESLVRFHFPGVGGEWSTALRLLWSGLELLLVAGFWCLMALWGVLHILGKLRSLDVHWTLTDTVIALLIVTFLYTAVVSSAIDVGKPEHRITVQLVIPLVVALIVQRIR